jgi:hypothetical protein
VWAAVNSARTVRNNRFRVIQIESQKWWTVVDQQFCMAAKQKVAFDVKSYRSDREHTIACRKASATVRKWQESLYRIVAKTGDTKCIPGHFRDNTHEQLLKIAVYKNNVAVIEMLIRADADLNYAAGRALRIAVHRNHQASVLALLKGGAFIHATRDVIFAPRHYGSPKRWLSFLANLVGHIKTAKLDEDLPLFDELVEIAQEPACRPAVLELAKYYPTLLAKLL